MRVQQHIVLAKALPVVTEALFGSLAPDLDLVDKHVAASTALGGIVDVLKGKGVAVGGREGHLLIAVHYKDIDVALGGGYGRREVEWSMAAAAELVLQVAKK